MIYFKLDSKPSNILELLLDGYTINNQKEFFKETFHDEELTIRQCHSARRSFEDLLEICQTYFPETTEIQLAKTLFELEKHGNFIWIYCPNIQKVVFRFHLSVVVPGYELSNMNSDYFIRYGDMKGIGKYSLRETQNLSKEE